MRGSTRVEILKLLRLHEGLSRADLAEALKMNRGNISRSITQLLDEGWVKERGIQPDACRESHRGQPPTRIEIHPQAFYACGLSIADEISISLVNALGEEVATKFLPNHFDRDHEGMISKIKTTIQDMCKAHKGRALGLGVVSSGNMRKDASHFFENHYLGKSESVEQLLSVLQGMHFGEVIPELIGNVYPLAEVQKTAELRRHKTIFSITEKLDLGVLWEGRMATSQDTKRLSIKHVKVKNNNSVCFCGKEGCLITLASIWSIMDRLEGYQPGTRAEPELASVSKDRERFYDLLEQGDPRVKAMVEIASDAIYEVLENLIVVFQPEVVYVPSWLSILPEIGIEKMKKEIQHYAEISRSGYLPKFSTQSYGRAQASLGAAILILERHYGQISPYKRPIEWAESI
jgi:predicted NBD/HSP70 family sugar kinase